MWKSFMMGISIMVYSTLDNVDGKQARRTSTLFNNKNRNLISYRNALRPWNGHLDKLHAWFPSRSDSKYEGPQTNHLSNIHVHHANLVLCLLDAVFHGSLQTGKDQRGRLRTSKLCFGLLYRTFPQCQCLERVPLVWQVQWRVPRFARLWTHVSTNFNQQEHSQGPDQKEKIGQLFNYFADFSWDHAITAQLPGSSQHIR